MNFEDFWPALEALEKTIKITKPISLQIKRAYWGAPAETIVDLPCTINSMTVPERLIGFGDRVSERYRINIQLLTAKAQGEISRSALIATYFWYAATKAFDNNVTLDGTVNFATLHGADPTVPVILTHAGIAYVGFNAILNIQEGI